MATVCQTCDCDVVGSNVTCGCCVPMPTRQAIPVRSVNEYQQKPWSKWAYHAMPSPHIHGLAASAGVRLRVNEWRSAHEAQKDLYCSFLLFFTTRCCAERGYVMVSRLTFSRSVMFVYPDHIVFLIFQK